MSTNIRTFKLTLYFSIATMLALFGSALFLTPISIDSSIGLLWLFDLSAAVAISMSLFYFTILIDRTAKILGITIDLLAAFY